MKGTKMTKEERNKLIVQMYSEGKPFSTICSVCCISDAQAKRVVKKAGLSKNKKPVVLTKLDEERIVQLYLDGDNSVNIAKQFNTSTDRIRQLVKRAGHKIRPLGAQKRIWTKEEIEQIIELCKSGMSQFNIGKLFKTNETGIHKVLLENYPDGIHTKRLAELHPKWNGGKVLASNKQYYQIKLYPNMEYYDMVNHAGYVMEHRLVMAKSLGRSLTSDETVHHIDGDTLNNDLSNLQLRKGLHGKHQKFECCQCGSHNIKTVEI